MCTVNVSYGENNINVGPLEELPEICIDHFFKDDLRSSAFFLSHAHTDHMVGLESSTFIRRLDAPGVKLYCHALTPLLLRSFPRYLGGEEGLHKLIREGKVVPLDAERPYRLDVPVGENGNGFNTSIEVTVTLLPAGHCPGSVMFLFETDSVRVLHTGDFRLTVDNLKASRHLHVGTGVTREPKRIDHLYVDTTFCSKSASLFPCRKEVTQKAIGYANEWISASQDNWIFITFAAKFAHEYILVKLWKAFGKKIHVTAERKEIYSQIPGLGDIVTLDPRTPFHFCNDKGCLGGEGEFIEMRLTSMWYTTINGSVPRESVVRTAKKLKVCYSMHSSLFEIAETIDYLRPKVVTPLVMPFRGSLKEVKESLYKICKEPFIYKDYHSPSDPNHEPSTSCKQVIPFSNKIVTPKSPGPEVFEQTVEDCQPDAEEEEFPNSQDFLPSTPEPVQYDPKYQWKFSFSPSPKKTTSESSGSQNNSSQEEKNNSQSMSPVPIPRMKITPGVTAHLSTEKITSRFEPRKRFLDFQTSLSKKKLKSDEKLEQDVEPAGCSNSFKNIQSNTICDTTIIDLTNDSSSDQESNSSNSQSLLSIL